MSHLPYTDLLKKIFAGFMKTDPELAAVYKCWGESRRAFLKTGLQAAAVAALAPVVTGFPKNTAAANRQVVIVGAGMAGLNTAYQLKKAGIKSMIYEASSRTGGRMYTLKDKFGAGITTDIGGEFVDSTHTDIMTLCQELGIELYDLREDKLQRKHFYFAGKRVEEADLYEAIKPYVKILVADIASLPARIDHTTAVSFQRLDDMSITEYIKSIGISGWLYDFLNVVLTREYGMEASRQSAVNFLIMFEPPPANEPEGRYELFGDSHEVFKIKGGSQHLTSTMTFTLTDRISYNHRLTGIAKSGSGTYELSFDHGNGIKKISADYVVLAIPFTILRKIPFSVPMSKEKRTAIDDLGYGNSCKFILGVNQKPWRLQGFQGYTFNDLAFGCGWDSSQMQSAQTGSFTVFGGGDNADDIFSGQQETLSKAYLQALDTTYPGVQAADSGTRVKFCWKNNPYTLAGYSSFTKGQWSRIAGYEAEPVEQIYFAGEHVSLAYQGYMMGAAQTGRIAAETIAARLQLAIRTPNPGRRTTNNEKRS